jgi:hypothetical protein
VIRRALAFVLTASALKLLNMGNVQLAVFLGAATVLGPIAWRFVRSTGGLRRGWPPAAKAASEDFSGELIPFAGSHPAEAAPPVELAGQGR